MENSKRTTTKTRMMAFLAMLILAIALVPAMTQEAYAASSKTLPYNRTNVVNAVGKQSGSSTCGSCCASMVCAYGDTMLLGKGVSHSSYTTDGKHGACKWSYWSKQTTDLNKVKAQIDAGKPVVLHVKNNSTWGTAGNQHWVLVVGYQNVGSTVSLGNLIILDPWDGTQLVANKRYNLHTDYRMYFSTRGLSVGHTCSYAVTGYKNKGYNTHTVTKKCSVCSKTTTANQACSFATYDSYYRKCSKCGKPGQPLTGNTVVGVNQGAYFIRAANDSSIVMDVYGGGSANGTKVWMHSFNKNNSQQFMLVKNRYGSYSIAHYPFGAPGKLVGVASWSVAERAGMVLRDYCDNHMINQWYVEKTPQGYYMFRNNYSNLYLDIKGYTPVKSGTVLQQFTGSSVLGNSMLFTLDRIGVDQATITGVANKRYTGAAQTCNLTVKVGNRTLVAGKDYTATYSNNVNPGKATVTIRGIGNYNGTVTKKFNIFPQPVSGLKLTAKTGGFTATWNKQTEQVTGYQIYYHKKGVSSWVVKNIANCNTSKMTTTVAKANRGKTFEVKIRSYKTSNGVKYFSAWSAVKTVVPKK